MKTLISLCFIFCSLTSLPTLSKTIDPISFSTLWNTGNKFRLMRQQSLSLNPKSDLYEENNIKVQFHQTNGDFQVKEDDGMLDTKMAGVRASLYTEHYFFDLGVMDIRDSVKRSGEDEILTKYSRAVLGARYNDLGYIGVSGGLIINGQPAVNENNEFIFDQEEGNSSPFLAVSGLGLQLMLNYSKEDNITVETTSYEHDFNDISASIIRSKIHNTGTNTERVNYKDEYVFQATKSIPCISERASLVSDCKVQLSRNDTRNDQSQGWSVLYQQQLFNIRLNRYDEQGVLRKKKFGGSASAGFHIKAEKNSSFKLMASIHINDGANHTIEIPDEYMVGVEMEMLGVMELFQGKFNRNSQ